MCGRFTLRASDTLQAFFHLAEAPGLAARYNIAPSQPVAVVGGKAGGTGLGLTMMRWGLVPARDRSAKAGGFPNARAESAADKPSFRDALRHRRCLIPADGFYEWRPPAEKGGRKRPVHFRLRDGGPFAFAGLWERHPTHGLTCCLLTTDANEVVSPVHDRMPVILEPGDFGLWLDRERIDPADILELARPYPARRMESAEVSAAVNDARHDQPDCLAAA